MSSTEANIQIERYFPEGCDPQAEPWKSIRRHHNSELAQQAFATGVAAGKLIRAQATTIEELQREAAYWKQDSEKHAQGLLEQAATIEGLRVSLKAEQQLAEKVASEQAATIGKLCAQLAETTQRHINLCDEILRSGIFRTTDAMQALKHLRAKVEEQAATIEELDRQVTLNRENWRMSSEEKDATIFSQAATIERLEKQLEVFRRNWPKTHKAIRSDIMLGEALEEIDALATLRAQLEEKEKKKGKTLMEVFGFTQK